MSITIDGLSLNQQSCVEEPAELVFLKARHEI